MYVLNWTFKYVGILKLVPFLQCFILCKIDKSCVKTQNIDVCLGQSKENDDSERTPGQAWKSQQQHSSWVEGWLRGLQVGGAARAGLAQMQAVIPPGAAVLSEGVGLLQKHSAASFVTLLLVELQLRWEQRHRTWKSLFNTSVCCYCINLCVKWLFRPLTPQRWCCVSACFLLPSTFSYFFI